MLAPQFTIRRLLVWTTGAALIALLAGFARQGSALAQSVMMVVLMLAALLMVSGGLYVAATLRLKGFRRTARNIGESPFAEHRPPPQMIHPEEPV